MFRRILVANRGEIACRVLRTARRLGIATVAVYSGADEHALHVQMADEAVAIGPPPARDSYLRPDLIIAAAKRTGAEAIHPGYGFLSENADFAAACAAAGLVFIGPGVDAIRAMGSKSAAKTLMAAAGIPVVPGYHGADQTDGKFATEAARIGYPVLLKAVAGGGGKGMRVVRTAGELAESLAAARREARGAFSDDAMLVEKYLTRPRHLEVQVFGDNQGQIVHLFERDCSLQRRHQKVLEEAPAPGLSAAERNTLGRLAVEAARAVRYTGAGTIEFIASPEGEFFFMEMNTRLQVEHPVTEFITGQDLVEWQLRVAAGEALPLGQAQIPLKGHAIEVRLCAEDPERQFLPATGVLRHLRLPAAGPDLRVEAGVQEHDAVTIHYDPLLAKLIAYGPDRAAALARLRAALRDTRVVGVRTNRDLLAALAGHPALAAGAVDTGFIEDHLAELVVPPPPVEDAAEIAALAVFLERRAASAPAAGTSTGAVSPWDAADGWRLNGPAELPVQAAGYLAQDGTALAVTLRGRQRHLAVVRDGDHLVLLEDGRCSRVPHPDSVSRAARPLVTGSLTAPMPGRVTMVRAKAGDGVRRGETLLVLEAMKMEHAIQAPVDGVVRQVLFAAGDLVDEGVELLVLDPS